LLSSMENWTGNTSTSSYLLRAKRFVRLIENKLV